MTECAETIEAAFEPVATAFFEAHADVSGGAQLCIYRDGVPVLDIATGEDTVSGRTYTSDLVTVVMSCTKGVMAICAHLLAQRGALEINAPVAQYWSEFGQNGKDAITVADVLSHRSGLAAFDPVDCIGAHECLDWERCTTALERMAPLWPPSTAYLYHFITHGVLVGELISRVSGKTISKFLEDEIVEPLGLELWLGLPKEQEHRVAPHIGHRVQFTRDGLSQLFASEGIDTSTRLVNAMIETMVTTEGLIDLLAERKGVPPLYRQRTQSPTQEVSRSFTRHASVTLTACNC